MAIIEKINTALKLSYRDPAMFDLSRKREELGADYEQWLMDKVVPFLQELVKDIMRKHMPALKMFTTKHAGDMDESSEWDSHPDVRGWHVEYDAKLYNYVRVPDSVDDVLSNEEINNVLQWTVMDIAEGYIVGLDAADWVDKAMFVGRMGGNLAVVPRDLHLLAPFISGEREGSDQIAISLANYLEGWGITINEYKNRLEDMLDIVYDYKTSVQRALEETGEYLSSMDFWNERIQEDVQGSLKISFRDPRKFSPHDLEDKFPDDDVRESYEEDVYMPELRNTAQRIYDDYYDVFDNFTTMHGRDLRASGWHLELYAKIWNYINVPDRVVEALGDEFVSEMINELINFEAEHFIEETKQLDWVDEVGFVGRSGGQLAVVPTDMDSIEPFLEGVDIQGVANLVYDYMEMEGHSIESFENEVTALLETIRQFSKDFDTQLRGLAESYSSEEYWLETYGEEIQEAEREQRERELEEDDDEEYEDEDDDDFEIVQGNLNTDFIKKQGMNNKVDYMPSGMGRVHDWDYDKERGWTFPWEATGPGLEDLDHSDIYHKDMFKLKDLEREEKEEVDWGERRNLEIWMSHENKDMFKMSAPMSLKFSYREPPKKRKGDYVRIRPNSVLWYDLIDVHEFSEERVRRAVGQVTWVRDDGKITGVIFDNDPQINSIVNNFVLKQDDLEHISREEFDEEWQRHVKEWEDDPDRTASLKFSTYDRAGYVIPGFGIETSNKHYDVIEMVLYNPEHYGMELDTWLSKQKEEIEYMLEDIEDYDVYEIFEEVEDYLIEEKGLVRVGMWDGPFSIAGANKKVIKDALNDIMAFAHGWLEPGVEFTLIAHAYDTEPLEITTTLEHLENDLRVYLSGKKVDPFTRDLWKRRESTLSFRHPSVADLNIGVDITDSYRGELFGYVYAVDKDRRTVGVIDFSAVGSEEEVAIKWIEVLPEWRRRGVATAMRDKLQEEFPTYTITAFGDFLTEEGQAWERSVQSYREPNIEQLMDAGVPGADHRFNKILQFMLKGRGKGRDKAERKMPGMLNTILRYDFVDNEIEGILYNTTIVLFMPNAIELNMGGWITPTTKRRIRQLLDFAGVDAFVDIRSDRGVQMLYVLQSGADSATVVPFFNGIQIDYDGNVLNAPEEEEEVEASLKFADPRSYTDISDIDQTPQKLEDKQRFFKRKHRPFPDGKKDERVYEFDAEDDKIFEPLNVKRDEDVKVDNIKLAFGYCNFNENSLSLSTITRDVNQNGTTDYEQSNKKVRQKRAEKAISRKTVDGEGSSIVKGIQHYAQEADVNPESVVYPTVEEIIRRHDMIIDQYGGRKGILSGGREQLDAAIGRARQGVFGADVFPSIPDKAAALMHSIISTHPFEDGNHRTALMTAVRFLHDNGWHLPNSEDLHTFVRSVSADRLSVENVASWIHAHATPVDVDKDQFGDTLERLASDPYFDSTPSEEVTPEERQGLKPPTDKELRRESPKRYIRLRDWYHDLNNLGQDTEISNRYDNPPQLSQSGAIKSLSFRDGKQQLKELEELGVTVNDDGTVRLYYGAPIKYVDTISDSGVIVFRSVRRDPEFAEWYFGSTPDIIQYYGDVAIPVDVSVQDIKLEAEIDDLLIFSVQGIPPGSTGHFEPVFVGNPIKKKSYREPTPEQLAEMGQFEKAFNVPGTLEKLKYLWKVFYGDTAFAQDTQGGIVFDGAIDFTDLDFIIEQAPNKYREVIHPRRIEQLLRQQEKFQIDSELESLEELAGMFVAEQVDDDPDHDFIKNLDTKVLKTGMGFSFELVHGDVVSKWLDIYDDYEKLRDDMRVDRIDEDEYDHEYKDILSRIYNEVIAGGETVYAGNPKTAAEVIKAIDGLLFDLIRGGRMYENLVDFLEYSDGWESLLESEYQEIIRKRRERKRRDVEQAGQYTMFPDITYGLTPPESSLKLSAVQPPPEFSTSDEALAYARTQMTADDIPQFRQKREEFIQLYNNYYNAGDYGNAMRAAFYAQLYREAVEFFEEDSFSLSSLKFSLMPYGDGVSLPEGESHDSYEVQPVEHVQHAPSTRREKRDRVRRKPGKEDKELIFEKGLHERHDRPEVYRDVTPYG